MRTHPKEKKKKEIKSSFDSLKRFYKRSWDFYCSVHGFATIDVPSRKAFQHIFFEKGLCMWPH